MQQFTPPRRPPLPALDGPPTVRPWAGVVRTPPFPRGPRPGPGPPLARPRRLAGRPTRLRKGPAPCRLVRVYPTETERGGYLFAYVVRSWVSRIFIGILEIRHRSNQA